MFVEVVSAKPMIVRSGKDTTSERLGEIFPGAWVEVLEIAKMPDGSIRARTIDGWITHTKEAHKETVAHMHPTKPPPKSTGASTARVMTVAEHGPMQPAHSQQAVGNPRQQ